MGRQCAVIPADSRVVNALAMDARHIRIMQAATPPAARGRLDPSGEAGDIQRFVSILKAFFGNL
jgi:hypothetical protein